MEKKSVLIREIPEESRPYERLILFGEKALSDGELLAILLKTGYAGNSSVSLANDILCLGDGSGLSFLFDASLEELCACKGLGKIKAVTIKAALELGRRAMQSTPFWMQKIITSSKDAIEVFENEMMHLTKEELHMLLLDTKHRIIRHSLISIGGLAAAGIYPRDLLREAVKANCSGFVLAHNHPSGDPAPSQSDIDSTHKIAKAAESLGIDLIDHIIVGKGSSVSLRELSYI